MPTFSAAFKQHWFQAAVLFILCLIVLIATTAPTVYVYDSAEFVIGAYRLGIVHAPGYALYLLLAHLFSWLPFGEIAFRVNLFSALCLALTGALLFITLARLIKTAWICAAAALMLVWSYFVWSSGTRAEVYAPQLFTLALCGWSLVRLYKKSSMATGDTLIVGASFGLAAAMHPVSVLFALGMVFAFYGLRVSWRRCLFAGGLSVLVFLCSLLYFPVRAAAHPSLNHAGQYMADGQFEAVNLQSVSGILWLLTGRQFASYFFTEGILPSLAQLLETFSLFWRNYLGIGVLLGIVGIGVLARKARGFLAVWLLFFLPCTYFFTTYGADDKDTMLAPAYLLWAVVIAFGLDWFLEQVAQPIRVAAAVGLAALMLIVNFPLMNLSHDTSVRDRAQRTLDAIPPEAMVFSDWFSLMPIEYLRVVEQERPDLTTYNLFLFPPEHAQHYVRELAQEDRPIVFLLKDQQFDWQQLLGLRYTPLSITLPSADDQPETSVIVGFTVTNPTS